MSVYDDPRLQEARGGYESAQRAATDSQAAGYTLPAQLKEALNKKFSTDNPLIQSRENALRGYLEAGTSAPLSVTPQSAGGQASVIYNPQQQANLIQQRRAVPMSQLSTSNYLLGLAQGGIPDIINATSDAHKAQTARLQGEATIKGDSYKNLLSELVTKAEEATRQRDEAFREREFQEKIRQFDVGEARKGSGGDGIDLMALLNRIEEMQTGNKVDDDWSKYESPEKKN